MKSIALCLGLLGTSPICLSQTAWSPLRESPNDPILDNTVGSWVLLETSPLNMLFVDSQTENYLYVQNGPQGQLEVHYKPNNTLLVNSPPIPTSQTVTAIVPRPGTSEVWIVDPFARGEDDPCYGAQGVISIIDTDQNAYVRTLAVGPEPYELCFTVDGSRAFVACAYKDQSTQCDSNFEEDMVSQIVAIDCSNYSKQVLTTDVPYLRSLTYQQSTDRLYVAAFHSGNNTTARTEVDGDHHAVEVVELNADTLTAFPGTMALPDEDVLVIDANGPSGIPFEIDRLCGVGGTIFSLDCSDDYIAVATQVALNDEIVTEANPIGGQVVDNKVVFFDTATLSPMDFSLDDHMFGGQAIGFAQPTDLIFDEREFGSNQDERQLYVACYGSDRVAAIRWNVNIPNSFNLQGFWNISPSNSGSSLPLMRSGPRTLSLAPSGDELYVYNQADLSYSTIGIAQNSSPPTSTTASVASHSLEYDPTPLSVKHGRSILINADFSPSKTSSCFSCHIDGDLDHAVWEISSTYSPEGIVAPADILEKDDKGPMVTQTLRGLLELGPYHWRGEKKDLDSFQDAFVNLFDHDPNSAEFIDLTSTFDDAVAYMSSLRHPPNPRQPLSRSYAGAYNRSGKGDAAAALAVFEGPKCSRCHALPLGSSGTSFNGANTNGGTGPILIGGVAPMVQIRDLRGVADKMTGIFEVGDEIGTRSRVGLGLTHSGAIGSVPDFVADPTFSLPASTQENMVAFLEAFDTGLAPSTHFLKTVRPGVGATQDFDNVFSLLRGQSGAAGNQITEGHCDFWVSFSLPQFDGSNNVIGYTAFTAAFDPGNDVFVGQQVAAPPINKDVLRSVVVPNPMDETQLGRPVTFFGVITGGAHRKARDMDNDGLLDLDEFAHGKDPLNWETDGDGIPDGVKVAGATSAGPTMVGPLRLVLQTESTMKFEFSTDQPARVKAFFGQTELPGGGSPRSEGFAVNHQLYVTEIPSQQQINILYSQNMRIEMANAAGQVNSLTHPVTSSMLDLTTKVKQVTAGPAILTQGSERIPVRIEIAKGDGYSLLGAYGLNVSANDVPYVVSFKAYYGRKITNGNDVDFVDVVPIPFPSPPPHPTGLPAEYHLTATPGGTGGIATADVLIPPAALALPPSQRRILIVVDALWDVPTALFDSVGNPIDVTNPTSRLGSFLEGESFEAGVADFGF